MVYIFLFSLNETQHKGIKKSLKDWLTNNFEKKIAIVFAIHSALETEK